MATKRSLMCRLYARVGYTQTKWYKPYTWDVLWPMFRRLHDKQCKG